MPYAERAKKQAFQNEWKRKRREEWIETHGPCACGSSKNLQIDHIDPTKKVSHRIWSWSDARREAELAKCHVLCEECHKKKHEAPHGSRRRYEKLGCRCPDCTFSHAEGMREWRARRAARVA